MRRAPAQQNDLAEPPEVGAVLARLHHAAKGDRRRMARRAPKLLAAVLAREGAQGRLNRLFEDVYFPVSPEQGRFLYLTARALGAKSIVEFGASFGVSTIYLAAAARHTGGRVVSSELEPSKHRAATANLAEAGLAGHAEIRLGDALETLRDVPGPVDLVLLDGWKALYLPLLELLAPQLRPGALVLADDVDARPQETRDYVAHVRSSDNGFRSTKLSVGDGLEYSYYAGPTR